MPRFRCSYAYEVSCFRDFTVEAPDEAAAQKIMDEALAAGKFDGVTAEPNVENYAGGDRCFVSGPDDDDGFHDPTEPTLEQVLAGG